jgi:hypothetical protein
VMVLAVPFFCLQLTFIYQNLSNVCSEFKFHKWKNKCLL